MTRQQLTDAIEKYRPYNEQEEMDQPLILNWIKNEKDAFLRENKIAHITASAWVVNKDRSKVLMVYHNIYHSWSWLGGHADGETDLLSVAIREVKEEGGKEVIVRLLKNQTGKSIFLFALDNSLISKRKGETALHVLAPISNGFKGRIFPDLCE